MNTFIALLRAVNVGGHNRIGMAPLRDLFTSIGFDNVRTYLQSGNIVACTSRKNSGPMALTIEREIERVFGHQVRVIVRTGEDFQRVISNNPYRKNVDWSRFYVAFLSEKPTASVLKQLRLPESGDDECEIRGREIYLRCPSGAGKTKLSNTFFEKSLGIVSTIRNWNTVTALSTMTDGNSPAAYSDSLLRNEDRTKNR